MVEAMVTPSSRMLGLTIDQFELQQSRKAVFVGIQRRAGMTAARMTNIRIQSGDVLSELNSFLSYPFCLQLGQR